MSRKKNIILSSLLMLSIACIIYFFSPENSLPPLVNYYLLYLPALFCSISCIVCMIWGSIQNKQMKKYVPSLLAQDLHYCTFQFATVNTLKERLISDKFEKKNIQACEQTISWFYKERKQQSKFYYPYTKVENILFAEMEDNLEVKVLMQEIDKQRLQNSDISKKEPVQVHSSILCIVGDAFSKNEISNLIKQFNLHPSMFLTVVLDTRESKIYRAIVPPKKTELFQLVNSYFS